MLALLMAATFGNAFATQGGPDAYGYIWKDSNEPGGPAFVWHDITSMPGAMQIQNLADDNAVGPFALNGWTFHYYWVDATQWKFGSNGWVGFNNIGNIASCFPLIPTQGGSGDNYLAPYMSDLSFLSSFPGQPNIGNVWYYDNGVDSLIIQWNNVPWWQNGTPDWIGSNTFQMILAAGDSSITFMYKDCDAVNWNNGANCPADLEIGIENITGNIGLEVFNEVVPADSYAVKFYYPAAVTFQVPDATPAWNANSDNAGQFFIGGATATPQNVMANIANVGNAAITNTITAAGDIRVPGAGSAFWSGSTTLATGLAAGADSTITFPTPVTFTIAGPHYNYKVTTTNSQDINASNNINIVEVVSAACTGDTMNLTYSSSPQPDGVIVWAGGVADEGGGIYVVPPIYPVTISAVDVYIPDVGQDPGVSDGFGVAVYDDSGVPGALLDSAGVAANAAIEDAWNRVRFQTGATITSGGFYVAWYQGGGNVGIGTETAPPISRRTYEILGGAWSPYRDITVNDLMMSVKLTATCPAVGVNNSNNLSVKLRAVPNPTNGNTSIRYELPSMSDVKITVVNIFGQTVFAMSEAAVSAGEHSLNLDANNFGSGVYFINLETQNEKFVTKLAVNR
jgi:hypothetical protein